MTELSIILKEARSDARVLRRTGHESEADLLDRFASAVETAAEEFLTFASETEASMFSGLRVRRLQGMFPALQARGHARKSGRNRQYRLCALPRRADTQNAFAAGAEAARGAA